MAVFVGNIEIIDDLALVPDVIAGRDYVHSHLEQVLRESRCDAETGSRVLSVGYDEIN